MVLSSPVMSWASCWLRVVMSPEAETSTNSGESTSSRLYWSRELMASDQLSSSFWNSLTWGPTSEVAVDEAVLTGTGAAASGAGAWAGAWAKTTQEQSRRAEKQTALRVIGSFELSWFDFSSL